MEFQQINTGSCRQIHIRWKKSAEDAFIRFLKDFTAANSDDYYMERWHCCSISLTVLFAKQDNVVIN